MDFHHGDTPFKGTAENGVSPDGRDAAGVTGEKATVNDREPSPPISIRRAQRVEMIGKGWSAKGLLTRIQNANPKWVPRFRERETGRGATKGKSKKYYVAGAGGVVRNRKHGVNAYNEAREGN